MRQRNLKVIWIITAGAAIALLVVTVRITQIAASDEIMVGKVVTLVGPNNLVFLRDSPSRVADVVTTVQRGSSARVVSFEVTAGQETWFLVETADGPGWVPGLIVERAANPALAGP